MSEGLPVVAIVGRPNVGKSTLMNRFLGRREAIVEARPGVTRDRKSVITEWRGVRFELVDTGGWIRARDDLGLDAKVSQQSEQAIDEADIVLLVADATLGVTEADAEVAEILRRRARPVLLVANKVDDALHEPAMWELTKLGLGDPWPVSALHGRGSADLLDRVVDLLEEAGAVAEDRLTVDVVETAEAGDPTVAVAIVGRPNVGKSTLFNRLVGEPRSVVHDLPGTTRDTIDTVVDTDLGAIRFIDTAGLRRRARVDEDTEYYSGLRALRAVDKADVALLLIDATEGVTNQDQRLAERVDAAGCPIVLVLNKWEVTDAEQREDVADQVARKLHFLGRMPIVRVSALTGRSVQRLLPLVQTALADYHRRIATKQVNEVIREAQSSQPAPGGAKVLYATQGAIDPPTFVLFANRHLPKTYLRYLERSLREAFSLDSTPIKIRVRRRDD